MPPYAWIIGGTRGIGRAVALRFAQAGYRLLLTYRGNHAAARETAAAVRALGADCETVAFDVADHAAVRAELEPRLTRAAPDALVLCAGVSRDNLLVWMKKEEWDTVLRTDLDGFFNVVQPVVFAMVKARAGRIVVLSSVSGVIGQAGQVNYSAAKAGLIGAAKALAREVGKRGILVNVVAPGLIETEMTAGLDLKAVLPLIPLGRPGKPEEVAAVVHFLCAENHYMQGQVLGVNGGLAL